jgi:hypothetical protein
VNSDFNNNGSLEIIVNMFNCRTFYMDGILLYGTANI